MQEQYINYIDINYINHVDQYNTENERYPNRWENIHEYQQFLKESNPLYFENEFIGFLYEHGFKQIVPFIERLEINNNKLIIKYNCDSEQYINLCLVTNYYLTHPTLYRMKITDALKFLINYWYFYGDDWNKGLDKAAMTGNWELPKFKPQRYLNEKLTNEIDPNLSTWNNFKVPMEVSLTGEMEIIEYTLEKLGFLELLTTYYAINDYYKKQNLYDFVYPESLFVDMFSFDNLNDFRERMKNIGIAVPKDDKYIKIEEYNENSFINKIIHLDENFIIERKKMINLDKLKQINDSLSTEENDKKLLIEYYKQVLEEINKLELANNKLTEYSETLNETAQLLRQIYTKCGYTTKLEEPFNSSNNIKDIIHIRKRNLQKSLDKIEYKIKYYGNIENIDIKELLKNLHSSMEFLNQDITEKDSQKSKIYSNLTLGQLTSFGTSHNGYNILLFDNVNFPDHVNYCYDILENKEIKKITKTIYPKLIDDFIEDMDKIYTQKQEIREIISNYIRLIHKIRRISNKYHVIIFD